MGGRNINFKWFTVAIKIILIISIKIFQTNIEISTSQTASLTFSASSSGIATINILVCTLLDLYVYKKYKYTLYNFFNKNYDILFCISLPAAYYSKIPIYHNFLNYFCSFRVYLIFYY